MTAEPIDYSEVFTVEEEDPCPDSGSPAREGRETDARRLAQRQKQVDFGKNTLGYQRYLDTVPREKRRRNKAGKWIDPQTPDIHQVISKRGFDGQIKTWRRLLHVWDPDNTGEEEPVSFAPKELPVYVPKEKTPKVDRKASTGANLTPLSNRRNFSDAAASAAPSACEAAPGTIAKKATTLPDNPSTSRKSFPSELDAKAELACNFLNVAFGTSSASKRDTPAIKQEEPEHPFGPSSVFKRGASASKPAAPEIKKEDSAEKEQAKPADPNSLRNKRGFDNAFEVPKGLNILEEILNEASNDSFMSISRPQYSNPPGGSASKRPHLSAVGDVLMNDQSTDSFAGMSWAKVAQPWADDEDDLDEVKL